MNSQTIIKTLVALLPLAPMTDDVLNQEISDNNTTEVSEYENYEGPTLEELIEAHNSNVPTIKGIDQHNVQVGDAFDPLEGVYAIDNQEGDITNQIEVTNGDIDTSNPGNYLVNYRVENSRGGWYEFNRRVTVSDAQTSEIEPKPPTEAELNGESNPIGSSNADEIQFVGVEDITINVGDDFNPIEGIEVIDESGSFISEKVHITGEVDTETPGEYTIAYSVFDKADTPVSVARTIVVE